MCGISGVYDPNGGISFEVRAELRQVSARLSHRGPDDQGFVDIPRFSAAHNRLAIIDLKTGQQPMVDDENGNVIVFNGEIYNYLELRETLRKQGCSFRTSSDTEVLLKCYGQWGTQMLRELNGMFAFALYDAKHNKLLLARDRFGEKPLYFCTTPERTYFASELGALSGFRECRKPFRAAAAVEYFAFGHIAGPEAAIEGVQQLAPATAALIDANGMNLSRFYERSPLEHRTLSDEEIAAGLSRAIALRLRADVPVASLLSGGIDSSLITLIAQRQSERPLQTFSFGWNGAEDELPYARSVAARARTQHHEIKLDRDAFMADLPGVVAAMDMPMADSAILVVYQLSKAIAQHGVKVVLSGDGGDELFGGYDWYRGGASTASRIKRMLRGRSRSAREYLEGKMVFDERELGTAFERSLVDALVTERVEEFSACADDVSGRISFDYSHFLPWVLMPKVDRMSMAHAVEVRAPLLDHNLVNAWCGVPESDKASPEETKVRVKKWCLAQELLSRELVERKKTGMNLPLSWWIRSNESMFRDVLLSCDSSVVGLFGSSRVRAWFDSVKGSTTVGWSQDAQKVWSAFTFELWRNARQKRDASAGDARP